MKNLTLKLNFESDIHLFRYIYKYTYTLAYQSRIERGLFDEPSSKPYINNWVNINLDACPIKKKKNNRHSRHVRFLETSPAIPPSI